MELGRSGATDLNRCCDTLRIHASLKTFASSPSRAFDSPSIFVRLNHDGMIADRPHPSWRLVALMAHRIIANNCGRKRISFALT